jgi:hypothetical protein
MQLNMYCDALGCGREQLHHTVLICPAMLYWLPAGH